jgi:hypothetical protein
MVVNIFVDHNGCVVQGPYGLELLEQWDLGFKYHSGHVHPSVFICVVFLVYNDLGSPTKYVFILELIEDWERPERLIFYVRPIYRTNCQQLLCQLLNFVVEREFWYHVSAVNLSVTRFFSEADPVLLQ